MKLIFFDVAKTMSFLPCLGMVIILYYKNGNDWGCKCHCFTHIRIKAWCFLISIHFWDPFRQSFSRCARHLRHRGALPASGQMQVYNVNYRCTNTHTHIYIYVYYHDNMWKTVNRYRSPWVNEPTNLFPWGLDNPFLVVHKLCWNPLVNCKVACGFQYVASIT